MDFISIVGLLIFIFIGLGFPSYVAYDLYQRWKTKPWRELAAANGLTYKYNKLFGRGDSITGIYRGYHLKLETVRRNVVSKEARTHIILSAHNPTNSRLSERKKGSLGESSTVRGALRLFTTSHQVRGQFKGGEDPEIVQYIQDDIVTDRKYLQSMFDLLADIADAYCSALGLESKAVPTLLKAVKSDENELRPIIFQLLKDIAEGIPTRPSDPDTNRSCLDCLAYYKVHKIDLSWPKTCMYYGCRICYNAQNYFEGKKVVAVLDRDMKENWSQQDDVLWVNWLARRALFDFDEVSIIQTTDEEVERFAVQVGNDTDPFREPRYKQMPCSIASDCELSENTKRILRRMFGQVEVRESIPKLK